MRSFSGIVVSAFVYPIMSLQAKVCAWSLQAKEKMFLTVISILGMVPHEASGVLRHIHFYHVIPVGWDL